MPRLKPSAWPIRWRLTALNVGILAATLLVLSSTFLLLLDQTLIDITAEHLRDQARAAIEPFDGPRFGGPLGRGRPAPPEGMPMFGRMAAGLVRRLSGPDTGALVFDSAGSLIAASEPAEDVEPWPRPPSDLLAAALGGVELSHVMEQDSRRTLVMLLPIRQADGTVVGVLELAGSLQLIDQLQIRLRTALVAGAGLAILVAGVLGLRATRGALRPLEQVIGAARRIEAGKLDERLRLGRRDEIGDLAEAFDSMLDRLAAVLAAQRRFVADAAHELRTPLTALGGMVEMLQLGADRGDRATVRRMLDTMDREIDRLSRLVTDLLTLTRLDARQRMATAPVDLGQVIADVASQTRVLARGQAIKLRIEAPATVLGDADRLKQVLINLAANSLAFTPPEGEIEFRLDRVDGHARMVVADTGSGIPSDVLPRVMDRFVRGDPSRARATGGSGLGLAIAREIVEAHGGSITLESEVGKGTNAIVELPLTARPADE